MQQSLFILLGVLSFFFAFPNQIVQIPLLILAYPYALCMLGEKALTRRDAFRTGWLCGTLGGTAIMSWVIVPMNEVAGIPFLLAAPCAIILGMYIGLYSGAFSTLTYLTRSQPCVYRVLFLGLGWYLLEYIRGLFLTGLPWASLSAAFVPWPPLIQGAALVGAYGLSGIFAALASIPAIQNNSRTGWIVASTLFAILAVTGWAFLEQSPLIAMTTQSTAQNSENTASTTDTSATSDTADTALTIMMIQGNIDQNVKWNPDLQHQTVTHYIQFTRQALAKLDTMHQKPDLIIWPETAMPFDIERHSLLTELVKNLVTSSETALLFGAPGFVPQKDSTPLNTRLPYSIFNRAYLFTPSQGLSTALYEKEHLVPFGEYMPPWLDIPFMRPLLQNVGNFSTGQQTQPLPLVRTTKTLEKLGILICYEAIFPELARERVAQGASLFINISNDAWFGKTPAAEQHLQLSAMRAVEQYRPIARATNTGITCFIDPYGRISARTKLFETTSLTNTILPQNANTIFYSLEPILPLVSLGGFMALCAIMFVRRKRQLILK